MNEIQINKSNITDASVAERSTSFIEERHVRISIDHFAFTANNITYALLGDRFNYWNFFPADSHKGIIPTWGYGTVIESTLEEIEEGERLYGYFPMATELIVKPARLNKYGFSDAAEHRLDLPAIYNYYERINATPRHKTEMEPGFMLFKPLFGTSFLINEFYEENEFFEAENIVLTSASSKTAIALAYQLHQKEDRIQIIGLTSKSNVEFVRSLAIYDTVIAYDDISDLKLKAVSIIDFAGNQELMLDLQTQLLSELKYCCVVGISHWDKQKREIKYPFKSEVFFAPSHMANKIREWGMIEYKKKLNSALLPFLAWTDGWMEITKINGSQAIVEKYQEAINGNMDPKEGINMSF